MFFQNLKDNGKSIEKNSKSCGKIETKRLVLRKLEKSDAKIIFAGWANDEEVTKYLTWHPHENIKVTENILAGWIEEYEEEYCYRYGIEFKEENKLIGMIDVVEYDGDIPEIGYVLGKAYWNKGYMSEAFEAFLAFLKNEGHKKIYIEADEKNKVSNTIIKKNGFKFLGKKRKIKLEFKNEIVAVNTYVLDIE